MTTSERPLPIDAVLPRLTDALARTGRCVLRAPTGAGKTTRVPGAILDAGLAGDGAVVLVEPRRIAARAAARWIARARGARVGDAVGHHVRFDRRASDDTRILAVTDGIFLRMLQADPFLSRVGAVVFDEFHERRLDTDLALAMTREVASDARDDLRIAVMSATLDPDPIAAWLGDAPVVTSEGRSFPVDVRYRPTVPPGDPSAIAAAVADALRDTDGHVLVFVAGTAEIDAAMRAIDVPADIDVLPLHGRLPADAQDRAIGASRRRKVVVATNVAETSVTIDGVTAVVDTGLARMPVHDAATGIGRLARGPISRASADQRAGRAGRTAPGIAIRLWSEPEQRGRADETPPEVVRGDLTGAVLELAAWGHGDAASFPWFESPSADALAHATTCLTRLGAFADGRITERGRAIARLPVHPRLGCVLLDAASRGVAADGARMVAMLAEADGSRPVHTAHRDSDSDVLDRLAANRGSSAIARRLERAVARVAPPVEPAADRATALRRALLAGFVDCVARRRDGDPRTGVLVGGRGVRFHASSAVREAPLVVCIDVVDTGGAEAVVRTASAIDRAWLDEASIRREDAVRFDVATGRVVGVRRTRYLDLVLDEAPAELPDPTRVAACLAEHVAPRLAEALALDDSDLGRWLARVACVRAWCPEVELPALDGDALVERLPELCIGCRSVAALRRTPLVARLAGTLRADQLAALDRLAPERIVVPSGSRIRVAYEVGRPPVLAVRIQELFGATETPTVAGGRVPVLLHLLAPNGRPQQITDDLAGFWTRTYPTVRKELRRRYPKHAWPEDPRDGSPERRPRRR